METEKTYTLNQLFKSGKIYWIKSLPTLKKWVLRDMQNNNYLKTTIVRDKFVPRYYFLDSNVKTYISKFQDGNV
jgi:hypothetical protein